MNNLIEALRQLFFRIASVVTMGRRWASTSVATTLNEAEHEKMTKGTEGKKRRSDAEK